MIVVTHTHKRRICQGNNQIHKNTPQFSHKNKSIKQNKQQIDFRIYKIFLIGAVLNDLLKWIWLTILIPFNQNATL